MSLVTAGIYCTISPLLSGAMKVCSIIRVRLQMLYRRRSVSTHVRLAVELSRPLQASATRRQSSATYDGEMPSDCEYECLWPWIVLVFVMITESPIFAHNHYIATRRQMFHFHDIWFKKGFEQLKWSSKVIQVQGHWKPRDSTKNTQYISFY